MGFIIELIHCLLREPSPTKQATCQPQTGLESKDVMDFPFSKWLWDDLSLVMQHGTRKSSPVERSGGDLGAASSALWPCAPATPLQDTCPEPWPEHRRRGRYKPKLFLQQCLSLHLKPCSSGASLHVCICSSPSHSLADPTSDRELLTARTLSYVFMQWKASSVGRE